jgi:hypothetical protein
MHCSTSDRRSGAPTGRGDGRGGGDSKTTEGGAQIDGELKVPEVDPGAWVGVRSEDGDRARVAGRGGNGRDRPREDRGGGVRRANSR